MIKNLKDDKKYYCLCCGRELDFIPTEDGGFCCVECEDSWFEGGCNDCGEGEDN